MAHTLALPCGGPRARADTSWLTSMRDVQTEPSAQCAAATGVQGDTNVVDGKPECHGAVGDLTPGTTPARLPGDPSWMFACVLAL